MRYVKVMDNIAEDITRDGIANLGEGYEKTDDINKADAILIRASDIHGLDLGPSVRVIARSGAGFNNIPLEECARRGQLMAYTHKGFWQCMDTLRDKNKLEKLWADGTAPWKVWED